jgi:hypothetical protein
MTDIQAEQKRIEQEQRDLAKDRLGTGWELCDEVSSIGGLASSHFRSKIDETLWEYCVIPSSLPIIVMPSDARLSGLLRGYLVYRRDKIIYGVR